MPRALCLLALLALAAALPSTASAKGFSRGVASAEVSTKSALLWTRSDKPGKLKLTVARDKRLKRGARTYGLRARRSTDNTVQRKVKGLKPGRKYFFRFTRKGGRSDRGTFRTAPKANSRKAVRFAWTADSDPVINPNTKKLNFAPFNVYKRMAREGNAFNVNLGDTIYSDTDSEFARADPLALTVSEKRAKYRTMLTAANLRRLRAAAGMYNHWDDHEFLNDFAIGQTRYPTVSGTDEGNSRIVTVDGRKLYRAGVKAFREYMPVTYSKARGIYRSFRWGRNLEVFFLDERSFRDPGADDNGTCDNPQGSGQRDYAPTAPQRLRTTFAAVSPALASPPPPSCLERINDPNRQYLGAAQFNRFTRAVQRSKAAFKVVMNELPIQQLFIDPYDRWEGYAAERTRLIEFLRDNVKNVVFLTTDVHANLVNDVRLSTFPEDGGPVNSGITEITTGPAGTDTFKDDINDDTGNSSAGDLANTFFLRQPPPNGPGIQCSNLDVFSYGQVKVTSSRLTVQLKDSNGKTVTDPDGKPCGPYVLARK
jgi:alkaline phosphatase D